MCLGGPGVPHEFLGGASRASLGVFGGSWGRPLGVPGEAPGGNKNMKFFSVGVVGESSGALGVISFVRGGSRV